MKVVSSAFYLLASVLFLTATAEDPPYDACVLQGDGMLQGVSLTECQSIGDGYVMCKEAVNMDERCTSINEQAQGNCGVTSNTPVSDGSACALPLEIQNDMMTCVAIIDENNNKDDVDMLWEKLRTAYPNRPFCLLQPKPREATDILSIPQAFNDGSTEDYYHQVVRDYGKEIIDPDDWYTLCNLDASRAKGITNLVTYLDTSGSTVEWDVESSLALFMETAKAKGFNVLSPVMNADEDYISPCLGATIDLLSAGQPNADPTNPDNGDEIDHFSSTSDESTIDGFSSISDDSNNVTVVQAPLPVEVQDDFVTCIAVIDENSEYPWVDERWAELRAKYPDRPFCLLRPTYPLDILHIPAAFFNDTVENIYYEGVVRDNGDPNITPDDWYSLCNLDNSKANGINNVIAFIDDSGSTYKYQLEQSLQLFQDNAVKNGFKILETSIQSDEDYIRPCLEASILASGNAPQHKPCTVTDYQSTSQESYYDVLSYDTDTVEVQLKQGLSQCELSYFAVEQDSECTVIAQNSILKPGDMLGSITPTCYPNAETGAMEANVVLHFGSVTTPMVGNNVCAFDPAGHSLSITISCVDEESEVSESQTDDEEESSSESSESEEIEESSSESEEFESAESQEESSWSSESEELGESSSMESTEDDMSSSSSPPPSSASESEVLQSSSVECLPQDTFCGGDEECCPGMTCVRFQCMPPPGVSALPFPGSGSDPNSPGMIDMSSSSEPESENNSTLIFGRDSSKIHQKIHHLRKNSVQESAVQDGPSSTASHPHHHTKHIRGSQAARSGGR